MSKTRLPQLRFSDFDEDWYKTTLGDIGDFKNGLNKAKEDFGFGKPFINLMDVFGKNVVDSSELSLVNASEKDLKNYTLEKGDVLFIRSSVKREGVGQAILVPKNLTGTVYSGFLIRFREKHDNLFDLYKKYCFSTIPFRKELLSYATSSANTNINQESLEQITFYYPSKEEQQKIADFLSSVDQKIQQLRRKKELLEEYKKGVMQKLFSQEIRFKDENGKDFPDWEIIRGGKVFKSHSNKDHDGDLPLLAATQDQGMVTREEADIDVNVSRKSILSYKIVEPGDFVISLRSFQGGIEYSEIKGICSPAYIILKPKRKIHDDFFRYYLKKESFIERLSKTVVGIRDGKQISYTAFSGVKLKFPSYHEQLKIAEFLNSVQTKIDFINLKINKIEDFKKGLLQQMFV